MHENHWSEVDHTADIAVHVWGADLRALFTHAAGATVTLIGGEHPQDGEPISHTVTLSAPDVETLLVDWLTEILILAEDGVKIEAIDLQEVTHDRCHGTLQGQSGAHFSNHIKAVTYSQLDIQHTAKGYKTHIVYDV